MLKKSYFLVSIFLLIFTLLSFVSCFGPSLITTDIKANLNIAVDNAKYTWNEEKGTYKYPLILEISNYSGFSVTISGVEIYVLNEDGSKLFETVVTDPQILKNLFSNNLTIPAKTKNTYSLVYNTPYRLIKKSFLVNVTVENNGNRKVASSKYEFVDKYQPYLLLSTGPIKFYQKGFLDWDNDSYTITVYAYLAESYMPTDIKYIKLFEPGENEKAYNLGFNKQLKDKYIISYYTLLVKSGKFKNGEYKVKTQFLEGSVFSSKQNISFKFADKNTSYFPEINYDDINFTIIVKNLPYKNNEIQFYKKIKDNFKLIAYYPIDEEGEYYIDDIISDLKYIKNMSESDLIGPISVNICSYTHSDSEINSLKLSEWNKVFYIYSKSVEIEF